MTVGIAVITPNGVVLGSDSQMTRHDISYKDQITKLERLGSRIGIVGAGSADFYQELLDQVTRYSYEEEPSVAEVARSVYTTAARLYVSLAQRLGRLASPQENLMPVIQEMVNMAHINLLIGGVDRDGSPRVYFGTPPFSLNSAERYSIIGSGTPYASMSLKPRYKSDARLDDAAKWTVRAIRETSEMDPYVGGEIQMALIDPGVEGGSFNRMNSQQLRGYLNDVLREDAAVRVVTGYWGESDFTSEHLRSATRNLINATSQFEEKYLEELLRRQEPL